MTSKKQYTCEKCKFTTLHRSSLYRHNKSRKHLRDACGNTIHRPKMYSCELCRYATAIKSNYTRHCKSKRHNNRVTPIDVPKKSKVLYECLACDKKFKTRLQCVSHLRNAVHQKNVRKKYPQTLYNPNGMCLGGINVKLCAAYFRRGGVPCNVKLPLRKGAKTPVREIIKEQPKEEIIQEVIEEKFEFKPISDTEIESAELFTRRDMTFYAYEEDIDKLRELTSKALKLVKHLGVELTDEGIELNYESLDSVNDIIYNIKNVCLDDNYLMDMYGIKWK